MKSQSSIIPASSKASAVLPKPSKAQIIQAMALELQQQNEAENKLREAARKKLQPQITKLLAREFRKKYTAEKLETELSFSSGDGYFWASAHISIKNPAIDPRLIKAWKDTEMLPTGLWELEEKIKKALDQESLNLIRQQPGFKDAVQSSLAMLGF